MMKCSNLIRRHGKTLLPLLAFFLLPIFSLGFSSESASAVSDISVTYDAGDSYSAWTPIFPSCDGDCLNDYHYLKIEFTNYDYSFPNIDAGAIRFYIRYNGSNTYNNYIKYNSSFQILSLPFDGHSINLFQFAVNGSFLFDTTFTLMTDYQSCPLPPSGSLSVTENGTYDVTNYAEAVVEVPDTETIIQGDYHDDLVDIKNIALVAIAVALFICFGRLILGMFMGVRR